MTNSNIITVKIDRKLLRRVKKLIKKESKKIQYASAKQFVNIAVMKLLNEEEKQ